MYAAVSASHGALRLARGVSACRRGDQSARSRLLQRRLAAILSLPKLPRRLVAFEEIETPSHDRSQRKRGVIADQEGQALGGRIRA